MRRRFGVLITVSLCALVGCSTPSPATSPPSVATVVPSYECTPEAGGSPRPCSEAEHADMVRMDALYAKAEALYRLYFQEEVRQDREGSAAAATPPFLAALTGDLLKQTVQLHRENARKAITGRGEQRLVWLKRSPGVRVSDAVVAVSACRDASAVTIFQGSKKIAKGIIGVETAYGRLVDGELRLFSVDSKVVSSCES